MKTPITVRVETELLAQARHCAQQKNRSLTNFIETVLRRRISEMTALHAPLQRQASRKAVSRLTDAA